MSGTLVLAIYAAVIATLGLAWQVYSWWHRRKSHVNVTVKGGFYAWTDGTLRDIVTVNATNRSEHVVRVTGVGLNLQDGSGNQLHMVNKSPGSTMPGTIDSNDSGDAYFLQDDLKQQGINFDKPFVAWVRLATGETIDSKPNKVFHSK